MSKSKYKVYNGKSLKKIFENSRIFFLTAMLVAGLCVGAAILKSDNALIVKIPELFREYSSLRAEQGILRNFCISFFINGLLIAVNIFFGFSLIGYPFLNILTLIKGLGTGAVCGYLYSAFGLTGFGYCVLLIIPGAAVSSLALILACNDSCEYSKNAFLKTIKGAGHYEKDETRVYLTRQLVFLGLCAASSGADALFNELFSNLFNI